MHAQVVTLGLNGITEEQFHEASGAETQIRQLRAATGCSAKLSQN